MRATPENRRTVYEAIKSYRADTSSAVSDATLAVRTGLALEVVEACTSALVEAEVLVRLDAIPDHPLYLPVIKSGHALQTLQTHSAHATGVGQDR